MPRGKKKKFISKKNAITFHVVHRSQQDPLAADESAPQHVLVPTCCERKKDELCQRQEEQQKYGIFFDDDYNYLQHLRSVNEIKVDWETTKPVNTKEDFPPLKNREDVAIELQPVKIHLPSSVFASTIEEEVGLLNKAAPHSGLRLDLDPDVVASMDDDFDFDNPDNQLEDNFLELANSGNEYNDISDAVSEYEGSESYSTEEGDEIASLKDSKFSFDAEETKSHFTNYSMSSSVIRRNKQLTLLDDCFEQVYSSYDDSEIGALDCEEIEGHIATTSDLLIQCAEEFEKQKASATAMHDTDRTLKLLGNMNTDSESETEMLEVPDKTEKWDCESILSTYSNLYNHPKLIVELKSPGYIRVSDRTGIPLDVLGNSGNKLTARALARLDAEQSRDNRAESIISTLSSLSIRSKNETPEEKRERKRAVREYRKERRLERKANSTAFKEEKLKQEKIMLNNKRYQQGIKLL